MLEFFESLSGSEQFAAALTALAGSIATAFGSYKSYGWWTTPTKASTLEAITKAISVSQKAGVEVDVNRPLKSWIDAAVNEKISLQKEVR